MSRAEGFGLVETIDTRKKSNKDGLVCFEIFDFLKEDKTVTDDEKWFEVYNLAKNGKCPYTEICPRHARSLAKKQQQSNIIL